MRRIRFSKKNNFLGEGEELGVYNLRNDLAIQRSGGGRIGPAPSGGCVPPISGAAARPQEVSSRAGGKVFLESPRYSDRAPDFFAGRGHQRKLDTGV